MIKARKSNTYDFVSRSIGSVPTHDFDWDLEIHFQMNRRESDPSSSYDTHREILFRVAVAVSDELGYLIAGCGIKGECRARVTAISVKNLLIPPGDRVSDWIDTYDTKRPRFNPYAQEADLYQVVVTISQTHSSDYFSDQLGKNFEPELAERLEVSLGMSRGIDFPYCHACSFRRSDYLISSLYTDELPRRAENPQVFGFHEQGHSPSQGLTTFKDSWNAVKPEDAKGPHLRLRAQFTTIVPSPGSIKVTCGTEASEVLLETLISASYQFGMLKAARGVPLSWRYYQISVAEASIAGFIPMKHTKGSLAALVNVSVWLPIDTEQSLNQALRNKLRFFIDKDIRKTFGLRPDELELPNPHVQALVNSTSLNQYKSAEV